MYCLNSGIDTLISDKLYGKAVNDICHLLGLVAGLRKKSLNGWNYILYFLPESILSIQMQFQMKNSCS
jgi:hypothetical protein